MCIPYDFILQISFSILYVIIASYEVRTEKRGNENGQKQRNQNECMRILDRMKIPYSHYTYECEEFVDGLQVADMLGLPHEKGI